MAVKVYILYYSMYGYIERLAKEVAKGVGSVEDVEATLWQVPETLSAEELDIMGAPPKSDVPIIIPSKLTEADGIIFLFQTTEVPQLKAFLDAVKNQSQTQQLAGKPTIILTSAIIQSGRHDASHTIPMLYDQGMICIRLTLEFKFQNKNDSVVGNLTGSPTYELLVAFHNGSYFAGITKRFKEGPEEL